MYTVDKQERTKYAKLMIKVRDLKKGRDGVTVTYPDDINGFVFGQINYWWVHALYEVIATTAEFEFANLMQTYDENGVTSHRLVTHVRRIYTIMDYTL